MTVAQQLIDASEDGGLAFGRRRAKREDQPLSPPLDGHDLAPARGRHELLWRGVLDLVGPVEPGVGDRPANDQRPQLARDRFHFGQLGHRRECIATKPPDT